MDSFSALQLRVAAIVASYWVVSISLVFLNKALLASPALSMPTPLFTTAFQCLLTVIICATLGAVGASAPQGSWFRQFPKVSYNVDTAKKLAPLSLIFVGMIAFNNLCLQYVEVSFYNVARSLTIVFNVIFTYYLLGQTTSFKTLICLAVVVAGFFIGSESEVNFSLLGTLFGISSSVFVSLNSIFTKKAMPAVNNNEWTLCAYNNINATLLLIPLILLTSEREIIAQNVHLFFSFSYWLLMVGGGVFGFLIGIVTIMQISTTSPLTHNISGTAKACLQTLLALVIWRNPTNFANLMGVFLVLLGSMLYSYVRNKEMMAAKAAPSVSPSSSSIAGASTSVHMSSTAESRSSLASRSGVSTDDVKTTAGGYTSVPVEDTLEAADDATFKK